MTRTCIAAVFFSDLLFLAAPSLYAVFHSTDPQVLRPSV